MIIVPIKEGENIERALKKFKRKFEKTGTVRELRARKNFEKPSVKNRIAHQKAVSSGSRKSSKPSTTPYNITRPPFRTVSFRFMSREG